MVYSMHNYDLVIARCVRATVARRGAILTKLVVRVVTGPSPHFDMQ